MSGSLTGDVALTCPAHEDPVWRLIEAHMPWVIRGEVFSTQFLSAGRSQDQGWKLHVSATPWSAAAVLAAALPILLAAGASCKVVSTRLRLLALNNGSFGAMQAGKFITVYPSDDEQAVRLALALHDATAGLPGPRVATDRPLRPRSLVHYRYGAFRALDGGKDGGPPNAVGSLRDAAGRMCPDRRELGDRPPPAGAVDPFERAGAYVPAAPRTPPLGGRYLVVDVLATSAFGGVYRAVDVKASPPRVCVLKEFWRDAGGDMQGRLAPERGAAEADLLARHDGDPRFPRCYSRFDLDGNAFIALEYVEGEALAVDVAARDQAARRFSLDEVVSIGRGAADALAHLHAKGLVFRDFKPANLIRTPAGGYRLVDFGLAWEEGGGPPSGIGTADFCSPQQWEGGGPATTDDVFSWGAVLHRLLCGDDGSPGPPAARAPVRELRSDVPTPLADVVDRALAPASADRFASMGEARDALEVAVESARGDCSQPLRDALDRAVAPGSADRLASMRDGLGAVTKAAMAAPAPRARAARPEAPPLSAGDALALACEVGDALCDAAIEREGGACWATRTGDGQGSFCGPDLYHGAAGIGLFLAELGRASGEDRYLDVARSAARWLAGPVWASGRAEPGLYCGEAGVGWFFIRLAALLDEPGYVTAAELRLRRLRGIPLESLDLLHGAAGLVVFLVRLADATGRRAYLDEAVATAELLIRSATPAPGDRPGCYWPAPTRARESEGPGFLGLAHGAAGIALALGELAAATGDERALSVAQGVAELLVDDARPDPDGGWSWREGLRDEKMRLQGQCHGAIGIGQFFLRLAALDPQDRYLDAARRAALTAIRELPERPAPGICHGVAGDGSLLLECSQRLGSASLRRHADECAAHLQRFRDAAHPGTYASASGSSRPDLLVGDAGVGWFYLRHGAADGGQDPVLR